MKNILIIGGNSGIGLELVKNLDGKANVFCASREPAAVEGIQAYHKWDVTTEELDVSWLPEELHGLVYCPGSIDLKPVSSLKLHHFEHDMQINFFGLVNVVKSVLGKLKRSGDAQIVTFSTVAVGRGMPFHASIAAAKGAVEGFSRSLAAELAPIIKVNCIAPSLIDTPLSKNLISNEKRLDAANQRHPLRKIGRPSDVSGIAEHLLLQNEGWMTGQIIGIDGGLSVI